METWAVVRDLLQSLQPGERLCLLPLSRVLVEEADRISEEIALLPPNALSGEELRVVSWPEREFQRFFGTPGRHAAFAGDDLFWAKSASTRVDLPAFFGSALLAFPVAMDWDKFLFPDSHEHHLEMLGSAMAKAERIMDLIRFERCNPWTPATLPGRAGLLDDTTFCAGLFCAPEDHESYIIAGQVLTHQVIAGIGLDMTSPVMVRPTGDGEVGAIARHALRLYSEALEAATETSRFVQLMSLIEFLADPDRYRSMKDTKKIIGREVARDRADYEAILQDFVLLTSEGGSAAEANRGLRHNIVHLGQRIEELTSADEREAIFRRLHRYVVPVIHRLRENSYAGEAWGVIEAIRAKDAVRLGLAGSEPV